MPLSEIQMKKANQSLTEFCHIRVPAHVRDQIRLEYDFRGSAATLFERRPVWNDPKAEWTKSKVAQFRFDEESLHWSLYCSDRNGKWHEYGPLTPKNDLEDLIIEVDEDPTGIFWG